MDRQRKRRVPIERETATGMIIILVSILIFSAGCFAAVYRDKENDREKELGSDSTLTVVEIMSVYGGTSGALSIEKLENEPNLLSTKEPFKDRVARIRIEMPDDEIVTVLFPDRETFDDHSRDRETIHKETIPAEREPGKVVPAFLEVTLYE